MGISSEYAASFEDKRTPQERLEQAAYALINECIALREAMLAMPAVLITNEAELDRVLDGAL